MTKLSEQTITLVLMKIEKILGIFALTVLLSACEFNQSVNKDLVTGAYSRGDGIGCDEVLIELNHQLENRNEFIYGEKVNFIFENVRGFSKEDGKVYPGLSMCIVKNEKDTVLNNPDLFADMGEGTDLSPLQLQANFFSSLPYENDEAYKIFIQIWDKKGDGTFSYEMPFSIEENDLLTIDNSGLSYSEIYLWDETNKLVLVNENIQSKNELILLFEDVDGFEIVNDTIYPVLSVKLFDKEGTVVLENENILREYQETGVLYEDFKGSQIPVTMTFSPGNIINPYTLNANLTDAKSDRKIEVRTELIME